MASEPQAAYGNWALLAAALEGTSAADQQRSKRFSAIDTQRAALLVRALMALSLLNAKACTVFVRVSHLDCRLVEILVNQMVSIIIPEAPHILKGTHPAPFNDPQHELFSLRVRLFPSPCTCLLFLRKAGH